MNHVTQDGMPICASEQDRADGNGRRAPNWSADRVMKQIPEFMNVSPDDPHPIFFTGEMVKHGSPLGFYIVG